MLEAGSVRPHNAVNILFKNVVDTAVSAIFYWLLGYGLAEGDEHWFLGGSKFALQGVMPKELSFFLYNWAFSATTSTIVSGLVAERTSMIAYMLYVAWDTVVINPVVVHWHWSTNGFLSPYHTHGQPFLDSGSYDFAGSGVVHMAGGFAGIVAAWCVGPRTGRFRPDGSVRDMPGHSLVLCTLGAFILWFGWFGFNCGSTLSLRNDAGWVASHVAITTTLAGATATVSASIFSRLVFHYYDLSMVINCLLGGLVAITR